MKTPKGVVTAALHLEFLATATCQYAFVKSNVEKTVQPASLAEKSLILGTE